MAFEVAAGSRSNTHRMSSRINRSRFMEGVSSVLAAAARFVEQLETRFAAGLIFCHTVTAEVLVSIACLRNSSNNTVERYLSPALGMMTTINFPACFGLRANCSAA